jgi:hypothetical protein
VPPIDTVNLEEPDGDRESDKSPATDEFTHAGWVKHVASIRENILSRTATTVARACTIRSKFRSRNNAAFDHRSILKVQLRQGSLPPKLK